MDVTLLGVTNRGRDMAKKVMDETADNLGTGKRRKLNSENLRSPSSTLVQTKGLDRQNYVNSPTKDELTDSGNACEGVRSIGVQLSCCSSTGSVEKIKVSDLEAESVATDTAERHKLDGSESRPTSELKVESVKPGETTTGIQSSVKNYYCRTVLPAEKMPPEAELEEFFAAAQEDLNKRFKDKYNYDILNDIPLTGRFEWIQVKPGK